jgi:predicted porin
MKKFLTFAVCVLLLSSLATVSLASITTTGEIDLDYFVHNSGYSDNSTLAEIGLYNDITINETTSAYIGLWMETNSGNEEQGYSYIDDAYIMKKIGSGSLKAGYGRYNIDGPLDVLGNGNFAMNLLGGSLEPAVQLLYTAPLSEELTLKAGYFYDWGANNYTWTGTETDGRNAYTLQVSYTEGPLFGDAAYLGIGKADDDTDDPSDEYIVDAGYKLGDNYTVYAAVLGADLGMSGTGNMGKRKNFVILGATATWGNFFAEVEAAVSTPDDWCLNIDGGEAKPFGFIVDYNFDKNTKLRFTRAINTNDLADFTKLQYIVIF